MKSLVWTAPREMVWQETDNASGKAGWIVVESLVAGICGSEVSAFVGDNELRHPPLVMGHEFSARVLDGAGSFKPGDLVTVNPLVTCGRCRACLSGHRQWCRQRSIIGIDFPGAFGTRVAVPLDQCYRIRDPRQGALAEPLACAVRAANLAEVTIGDAVVVIGAGIIGLMTAWVARNRGARMVAVADANLARLAQATHWGATDTIDVRGQDLWDSVRDAAPEGVDAVVDAVGVVATRQASLAVSRRGGRVVWIGLHESETAIGGNQVIRDELQVRGSFCYTDEEFMTSVGLVNSGFVDRPGAWLDVRPVTDGPDAFREQAVGPAPYAKILLQLND